MFILTGLACNGKSTMLNPLKFLLQLNFPDKQVLTSTEYVPVQFFVADLFKDNSSVTAAFDYVSVKQFAFLSVVLKQHEILKSVEKLGIPVISDRGVIDCLAYSVMMNTMSLQTAKKIAQEQNLKSDVLLWLVLPSSYDVLSKCFERKERAQTIGGWETSILEQEQKFKEIMIDILGEEFKTFPHPTDNSYVIYEIADIIINHMK